MPGQPADVVHYKLRDHCWAQHRANANEYLTTKEWWWAGEGDAKEGRKAACCLLFSMTFSFYILIIIFAYTFITYVGAFPYYFLSFFLLIMRTIHWYFFQHSWTHGKTSLQLLEKDAMGRNQLQHDAAVAPVTNRQAKNMMPLKQNWGIALKTEISHNFCVKVILINRIKTCTGKSPVIQLHVCV